MKKVDIPVLKDASKRLLFEMREEEYETLLDEFSILTKQMEAIGRIEGLEAYGPMTFPFDVSVTEMREDEAEGTLDRRDALSNAGSVYMDQVKIPKVVG